MPVFTSEITLEEVKMAMENVSTQDVNNWLGLNTCPRADGDR